MQTTYFTSPGAFCEVPFEPGRETRASAAAQAGGLELVDDVVGFISKSASLEAGVAVARDVLVDVLGVDDAAVAQHDAELLLVELDVLDLHRCPALFRPFYTGGA